MIIAISRVTPSMQDGKTFRSALRLLVGAGCPKIVPLLKNVPAITIEKIRSDLVRNISTESILITP